MWQDEPYTYRERQAYKKHRKFGKVQDWGGAVEYCKNLTIGGYNDWRLPELKDWNDLYLHKKSLSSTLLGGFWSSSSPNSDKKYTWRVFLNGGGISYRSGDTVKIAYIRCVRDRRKFDY